MYQPNLHFKNSLMPTGNPQSISAGASPTSFRNMTSPHQNQVRQYPFLPREPYPVPMETKISYSNNNDPYKVQAQRSHASAIVRPAENSFNNRVFNNFDGAVLAHPAVRNNFALPKQVFGSSSRNVLIPQNYDRNQGRVDFTVNEYEDKRTANSVKSLEEMAKTAKRNENEKIRIFTGTAEKIIKWHKIYKNYFCFYEIIASIVSIQEGTVRLQKIMLLRDKKGPIIQIIHYVMDHINIENFFVGQMLRCVGRMVGPNLMHGLSIREATPDEVATLQRMCYISDHAISKALTRA